MSDVSRNIERVERLEQAYNDRDYDTVRTIVAPDFVANTPGAQMMPPGIEGAIMANEGAHSAFPDQRTEIVDIFGDGDRIVSHVHMTGTNDGGLPWAGMPANGAKVDIDWIQISRFADDGTIQETWAQMDLAKMMMQLGATPAPEGM